jgi:hypothetical protein
MPEKSRPDLNGCAAGFLPGEPAMPFKKRDAQTRPPRQWAIVGYPGSGKSTFAA